MNVEGEVPAPLQKLEQMNCWIYLFKQAVRAETQMHRCTSNCH